MDETHAPTKKCGSRNTEFNESDEEEQTIISRREKMSVFKEPGDSAVNCGNSPSLRVGLEKSALLT
jgi:hypothetical protein